MAEEVEEERGGQFSNKERKESVGLNLNVGEEKRPEIGFERSVAPLQYTWHMQGSLVVTR